MTELEYLGLEYIRPPNHVVCEIVERFVVFHTSPTILSRLFNIDEYTIRQVISEVWITGAIEHPVIIVKQSNV